MNNENNQNEQWKLLVLRLKKTAEDNNITQNEIAKLTGMQQSAVSRFMLLKYKPRLDTFILFANAIDPNFFTKD